MSNVPIRLSPAATIPMEHNRRLREEREQKRPIITDTKQEIALWNIWIYYQKDIMRRLAQQKGAMGGGLDDD